MPRPALYSSSRPARRTAAPADSDAAIPGEQSSAATEAGGTAPAGPSALAPGKPPAYGQRQTRSLWALVLVLSALLLASLWVQQRPAPRKITQEDIDAAVLRTLETTTPPSAAARAVEAIAPSIVR